MNVKDSSHKSLHQYVVAKYIATTLHCIADKSKLSRLCVICNAKYFLKYSYTCASCSQRFCCIHYAKHLQYNVIGNALPISMDCTVNSIFIHEDNFGISKKRFMNIIKYVHRNNADIHIVEGGIDYLLKSTLIIAQIMPYLSTLGAVMSRYWLFISYRARD